MTLEVNDHVAPSHAWGRIEAFFCGESLGVSRQFRSHEVSSQSGMWNVTASMSPFLIAPFLAATQVHYVQAGVLILFFFIFFSFFLVSTYWYYALLYLLLDVFPFYV